LRQEFRYLAEYDIEPSQCLQSLWSTEGSFAIGTINTKILYFV
jgi:hypothetical protein